MRVHFLGILSCLFLFYNVSSSGYGFSYGYGYTYEYIYGYGASAVSFYIPIPSSSSSSSSSGPTNNSYMHSIGEYLAYTQHCTNGYLHLLDLNAEGGYLYSASSTMKNIGKYISFQTQQAFRINTRTSPPPPPPVLEHQTKQNKEKYEYKHDQENVMDRRTSTGSNENENEDTKPSHSKHDTNTSAINSKMISIDAQFDITKSTETNYRHLHMEFHGLYPDIRSTIDYTYHSNYTPQRQIVQDKIITHVLHLNRPKIIHDAINGKSCLAPEIPWIVFTAGAMGSGKSYTIRHLYQMDRFPMDQFMTVDPDEIRRLLPEWDRYLDHDAEMAGERTRKEAGLIAELITQISLRDGRNVLVDGSLKDSDWYKDYFLELRNQFGDRGLRIGILHITAPTEAIFDRARRRSQITKRVVPQYILEHAIDKVPKSVKILSPLADFVAELHNAPSTSDIELVTDGMTWSSFTSVWSQTCEANEAERGEGGGGVAEEEHECYSVVDDFENDMKLCTDDDRNTCTCTMDITESMRILSKL